MEELKTKVGQLADSVSDYLKTYYELKVLNAADKATTVGASALAALSVVFISFFVLLFSGLALGAWLGNKFGSLPLGFLTVAGIFLVAAVVLVALRRRIIFPIIRNSLINKIYEPNRKDL